MKIVRRDVGDVTILDLEGRIVMGDDDLHEEIERLKREDRLKVVLNLASLTYTDSDGFGEILRAWRNIAGARQVRGRLKLLSPHGEVRLSPHGQMADVLTITKLFTVLETYEDEKGAIASFADPSHAVES
jgi:anti-anti-sigma factor